MTTKNFVRLLIALGMPLISVCWGFADEPRSPGSVFYVAPWGNDGWSGHHPEANAAKTDGPLATLQRARAELRKLAPGQARKVVIRGGSYFLSETFRLGKEDSGTPERPVVWQATSGEEVRLIGGRMLPAEAFRHVADPGVLARLDPAARGKVLQADLAALKIPLPEAFPTKFHGASPAPDLFFNGQRMTLARWPNEGWATIAKIIDHGSRPSASRDWLAHSPGWDAGNRPGIFEHSGDRPARWNVAAGVWLHGYWCYDWYDEVIRVKAVDPAKHRITLASPHAYGLYQGNVMPRRFQAINLLEELDQPGEYYIDRSTGTFYFWPPAKLSGARTVLATLSAPVVALKDASHVVLRGFIVEDSQGDGMAIDGGIANRIEACVVQNVRQMGIRVNSGRRHRVEACDIHDTGTGGLLLAGGDRKTLTPAGHEALNNHIWRFSQHQLTGAFGIHFKGVGNRAAHNLIHDVPHQAVCISGNDHVFECNVIHDVCTQSDDCGALYKGRNPSCRGNMIRYNFWHHIGNPKGAGTLGLYFDDGDGGDTVFGNVFFRCGEPGTSAAVYSHGGHDILAENNVFIDCHRAFGSTPWTDQRWRRALDGGENCHWDVLLRKDVDITKPPYTTHYPSLVGFLDYQPGKQPRISRGVRNLIVRCADVRAGNWQVKPEENWVVDHDPGFVDAAHGDFQLKPSAEVFTRLPGFKPIPFEKMGLYADELRPKPPAEIWRATR
jgi:hypothetical protein